MHKKGAIELSVNMLVVIIISLVILGGGIAFLYKLIAGAEDIRKDLDRRTEEELRRLLVEEGKTVALPFRQATIEREESHVFGLGILNIGGSGEQFQIQVQLAKVIDRQGEDITSEVSTEEAESWALYIKEPLLIKENEHHSEGISFSIPRTALIGQYLFEVRVVAETGEQYGNTQNIIIDVT